MTPSPHDEPGTGRRAPRYGDFPELFQDARPDAVIDPADPTTLARVLSEGDERAIAELVTLGSLRQHLTSLWLPEHTRLFWTRVLEIASNEGG